MTDMPLHEARAGIIARRHHVGIYPDGDKDVAAIFREVVVNACGLRLLHLR